MQILYILFLKAFQTSYDHVVKCVHFRLHLEIYSNLKTSSLATTKCQCQPLSWQSNLVQRMVKE